MGNLSLRALAQFELAQQYTCGNGEPRTSEEAPVALLKKTASAGVKKAQFALAERYCVGLGVQADRAEAIRLYRTLAAKTNSPSQDYAAKARRSLALLEDKIKSGNTR